MRGRADERGADGGGETAGGARAARAVLVAVAMFVGGDAVGVTKLPPLDTKVCRALTPLVAVNVVGLSLNTLCLHYVQASFYQVAHARSDEGGRGRTRVDVVGRGWT